MDGRLLFLALGWLAGWWLLWRVVPLARAVGAPRTPDGPGAPVPTVDCAVVIPARNEEGSLPNLLASLAHQTVRPSEVVVVDDQSTDRTAALAADAGVRVLAGRPLPAGWTGKAWACEQAIGATEASTLLFVDADVTLAPTAVDAVLTATRERGGLVSVQPFHRMERAYERLSAPFNVVSFMGIGAASPRRDAAASGAFGPVLCCRRDDLAAAGSFAGVRGEIVEDMALARRFRDRGQPVHAFGGGSLVSFRMYPDGVGSLVEGWTKNFATGAATAAVGRVALVFLWITALLASLQLAVDVAMGWSTLPVAALAVVYAAFALQLRLMLGQLGDFGAVTAGLYPLAALVFVAVFARSLWFTVVRREVRWRGRTIPLSKRARWSRAPTSHG